MQEFRQLFNYPEDLLFFNSGSMSLSPRSVIDAAANEKIKFEHNPTEALFGAWERLWALQKRLAHFFKIRPEDMYLRQNVTFAMNDFIMALKLPPGSEILVSDLEYQAITKMCEHKAKISGYSVREFKLHDANKTHLINDDKILEKIEDSLSPRTKAVMLSHVMTGTGLKLPINKIGQLLRSKNIFFIVDGAQGLGSTEIDFNPNHLDYYGTNLHKWFMGPKATGFAWVAEHMREHLEPQFAGWTTGEIPHLFTVFGNGDRWALRWMLCSTVNFADYLAINAALDFWQKHSPQTIYSEQKKARHILTNALESCPDWEPLTHYPESHQGPLISYKIPPKVKSETLMKDLEKLKLIVSTPMVENKTILRLSPNIYNTSREAEKVCEILKRL